MIFFSKRLKFFREKLGYSQKQIAEILGIDRSTYTYYETGKSKPSLDTLSKLCKIYNVDYKDILSEEQKDELVLADAKHEPDKDSKKNKTDIIFDEKIYNLSAKEKELLAHFRLLAKEDKDKLLKNISEKSKQN